MENVYKYVRLFYADSLISVFVYVSVLTEQGKCDTEIRVRIETARGVFQKLNK